MSLYIDDLSIAQQIISKQGRAYFEEVIWHVLRKLRALYPAISTFGVTEVLGRGGLSSYHVKALQEAGIAHMAITGSERIAEGHRESLQLTPSLGVTVSDPMLKYPDTCPKQVALFPNSLMHFTTEQRQLLVKAARSSSMVTMAVNWNMSNPSAMVISKATLGYELLMEFLYLYSTISGICGANPAQGAENRILFEGLNVFTQVEHLSFERMSDNFCEELREVGRSMLNGIKEFPTYRRLADELSSWLVRADGRDIVFIPPPLNVTVGYRYLPDTN